MIIYSLFILLAQLWTSLLFHVGSNCCFLTCIQISQETGKVIWYSHLLKNSPESFLKKNFPVGTIFTCQDVRVAWTSACHSVLPLFWWESSSHLPHLCLTVLLIWSVHGEGRRWNKLSFLLLGLLIKRAILRQPQPHTACFDYEIQGILTYAIIRWHLGVPRGRLFHMLELCN